MFKKLRLKIALWVLNEKDLFNMEIHKLRIDASNKLAVIIRSEYIALTKASASLNAEISLAEKSIEDAIKGGDTKLADNMKKKLAYKDTLAKEYSKKLFAFLGMFDAYRIDKIKPEELK